VQVGERFLCWRLDLMCGICGFLGWSDGPLQRMTDCITHRGPDEEGVCVDGVGLGIRRLSIMMWRAATD
jgi:asparagine synthetase B (glutamine-hydrolysing)